MEMRKNMTLRVGIIAAIVALITLVGISGTFAKYTSGKSFDSAQTARVAKWGVTVSSDTSALFSAQYKNDDNQIIVQSANNTDLVMAPGTSGKVTFLSIPAGTPEVTFQTSFGASGSTDNLLANWTTTSTDFYFPVSLKINGNEMPTDARQSLTAANTWLKNQFSGSGSQTYVAGTAITTPVDISIEWSWALSGSDFGQNDAKDTILAQAETAPTITIPAFEAKAEQVTSWS